MKTATLSTLMLAAASVCLVNSTDAPTAAPTTASPSTTAPTPQLEYEPGNMFDLLEENLYISQGMTVRVIARSGQRVPYANGGESLVDFHSQPDGAASFLDERPENLNGWVYVSNSEAENGGVGGITFDSAGNVLEYKMLLTGTTLNCNGGKTLWNTWVSCEEDMTNLQGKAWQVDPFGVRDPVVITHGSTGGGWESFSHDTRDPSVLYAFLSEDISYGAVQRQTLQNPNYTDPWNILLNSGPVDFLYIDPNTGTFQWITDEEKARDNAHHVYPQTEGMEMVGGDLILISKALYGFFRLNLDTRTYTFETTGFEGQPDQSTTVQQDDGTLLTYFTEEAPPVQGCLGQQVGIYTRNEQGVYVNILYGKDVSSETTGIAFSPDGKFMYFALQGDGVVFEAKRTDGLSFHAQKLEYQPSDGCGLERTITNSVKSVFNRFRHWLVKP